MIRPSLCALFLAALVGCSSSQPEAPPDQTGSKEPVLNEVGGLLRSAGADGQGPRKPEDLAKYEHGYPLGYAAVRSGDVVVIWGAKATPEGEVAAGKGGTSIIAYEKNAPTEGGWVLLENGKVQKMSADEFKAAPKAK